MNIINMKLTILSFAIFLIAANQVSACPTTCVNTYTADVTPGQNLILYMWNSSGKGDAGDSFYSGASFGISDNFEIGTTWQFDQNDGSEHQPILDLKFRYNLSDSEESTTGLAVGIDNVSDDRENNGDMNPYVVYTYDFTTFRTHAGYSFQDDNQALFAGADVCLGEVSFLADWTQTNGGDDWLGGLGIAVPIGPDDSGWSASATYAFTSETGSSNTWSVTVQHELTAQ